MKQRRGSGFTLIELILYVGIASTMLLLVSLFVGTVLEARVKAQATMEVNEQGRAALARILQTTRNAEAVLSPIAETSNATLSLDTYAAAAEPTVVDISSNALRIREGSGNPVALTNSRAHISAFFAENLSRPGTPGTIRVQFTITHVNPSGRAEYDVQQIFTGSATLRHP